MERVVIGLALVDDEMEVGDGCPAAETYISVYCCPVKLKRA